MRLTSFTDYSLRALMNIALKPAQLATVLEIARAHDISQNHLMKVVHQLAKSGVIVSVRGKGGGICLALPAKDIRLGAAIRLAEGAAPECLGGEPQFNLIPACKLKAVLVDAFTALYGVLDNFTLADTVSQPQALVQLIRQ